MLKYLKLKLKYSKLFYWLRSICNLSPYEEIIEKSMIFSKISETKGDYLEFGVYEGRTFIYAHHLAQKYGHNLMRFYAFDSFAGLPAITGKDAQDFCFYKKGDYACEIKKFKKNLHKSGVDFKKITIVPGWYKNILNEETRRFLPIKKAAIIYIDCDLYESAKLVLDFVTNYIKDGTVIIFDDWFDFRGDPQRGEMGAFNEWQKANLQFTVTEFHKFHFGGNSFIISLKK